ncbi:MAG: 2-isopropylmalate synthase [Planctomycetota bacterium]|jgi:2-isopropylmalate synthase
MSSHRPTPKYAPPAPIQLPDRQWPSKRIEKAPQWCSVDLRDGNQALPDPMGPEQKLSYFRLLCDIGLKHIEVAFPSGSKDDFEFARRLIEDGLIPNDVFIMVLSVCRAGEIERTVQAIEGLGRGIVHLYLATSELHLMQVFAKKRAECLRMLADSAEQVRELTDSMPESDIRFEFSPEEFTDSDLGFVLEACETVAETWGKATAEMPLIINLPATVERRPPNDYADMIEWFCRNFSRRDTSTVSLHAHNDQGMAVAATELALLAGADRVEGTLFGHGERTGNVDLVTLANNLSSRGIPTGLDFSDLPRISETVARLTGIPVYCRQPYAGELVFTAFSGTHQDAIRKGMHKLSEAAEEFGMGWKVPYLHVDPADLGRHYERLIRISSQSGKGGAAWVLEQDYGLDLPKAMHPELGAAVQRYADQVQREIASEEVYRLFQDEFVHPPGPYELLGYWPRPDDTDPTRIHGEVRMKVNGVEQTESADGNGPVSAFAHAMHKFSAPEFAIEDYDEQALGKGADAQAVAYVPLKTVVSGLNRITTRQGADTGTEQRDEPPPGHKTQAPERRR